MSDPVVTIHALHLCDVGGGDSGLVERRFHVFVDDCAAVGLRHLDPGEVLFLRIRGDEAHIRAGVPFDTPDVFLKSTTERPHHQGDLGLCIRFIGSKVPAHPHRVVQVG